MLEKANRFERNVSPAKPDVARAFERLTSTEPLYDARLTELAAQPNRIKNNRAFRYAQLLTLAFTLSTSLAERAAAQETVTPRIEAGTEDAEQKKFEGMRVVYQTEVSHLKSLGYELSPAPHLFEFGGFDKKDTARILGEAHTMIEYATKYKEMYARGASPPAYELRVPIHASANKIATAYQNIPSAPFEPYNSPLDYLAEVGGGVGEVHPDLLSSADRKLNVPMTSFESIEQNGSVILTIHNWLADAPPEKITFGSKSEAAEYLIKNHIESAPAAQSRLDTIQAKKKENWSFALYPDPNKKLTDAQIEAFQRIYERVQSVKINYWPEARTADVDMYGLVAMAYSPTYQSIKLTKKMFESANGHQLVFNRKILMMLFKLKPEYITLPGTDYLERTYESDEDGNMLVHVRSKSPEEILNIQPSFAHCSEEKCTGRVPLNLDLRKLALPQIKGAFTQDMKAPMGQFVQHGPFKLYSGYSREVFDRNASKNAPEFANGIAVMEQYFGVAAGTHVKGIHFNDIPAIKPKPNAGVDPQTFGIIDIEDLRDGDYHVGVGRHETVHAVDFKLMISGDARFVALYDGIRKQQPAFFNLISETHFLKDDSNGKELGHASSNPGELLASFINGLHASRWEEKVNAFTDEQRAIYKDMLTVVLTILQEKAAAGLLPQGAPIFVDIKSKLEKLP